MLRCRAELCLYWTGSGCTCEVFDIEPEAAGESASDCSRHRPKDWDLCDMGCQTDDESTTETKDES